MKMNDSVGVVLKVGEIYAMILYLQLGLEHRHGKGLSSRIIKRLLPGLMGMVIATGVDIPKDILEVWKRDWAPVDNIRKALVQRVN